ncbi:MAG: hypothetical protein JWP25_6368 [Bradyrhizobium sp.]|jgi:hypothetical protein|nr:hypothetical protein [Bradyrhizobium sp.]
MYDNAVSHLIEECHSTRCWNDLERLMSQLRELLPHRYFGCAEVRPASHIGGPASRPKRRQTVQGNLFLYWRKNFLS